MAELSLVGKSIPRIDILEKVTGAAQYCADLKRPGTLYAKILRSPYAHARIKHIDTSKVEKLPGVRVVVTGADAPDVRIGVAIFDQYVLPRDNLVRCIGQPVAAVAADTIDIAEDALELIDVDYEELPAVFDPEQAMEKDPPATIHPDLPRYPYWAARLLWHPEPDRPNVCYHFKIREGDAEAGFQDADLVLENRYSTVRMHHCQMETHRADAWVEPDGTLALRTSTQGIWGANRTLCTLFNLPPSRVRVYSPYLGGGFGGKTLPLVEPIAALLAMKGKRPVRLILTREEQFVDGRQRPAIITYIKDGVKKDGRLVAREMKIILDVGRHSDLTSVVVKNCTYGAVGTYSIPNFKLDSYGVYTNNPITGPFRGFGTPEITWAIEQQMDMLAQKLGMDAARIRLMNTLREGERDVCGQSTHSIGVNECLDRVTKWIEWDKKPVEHEGSWRRGKGIAIGNKYTGTVTSSVAIVKVYPDGIVEVRHGTDEQGQGINTVVAQIAGEEFGVSVDRIKVVRGDTAYCPYDFGAVSSRCTFFTGNAVRRACQDAKRQILEMAAGKLGLSVNDVTLKEGKVHVIGWPGKLVKISELFSPDGIPLKGGEVIGTGSYHSFSILENPETGQSEKMVTYYGHGAHAIEVTVNVETGEVKIVRIAGAFDMGTPINPKMVEAQIEGGFSAGIGSALCEQIVMDRGVVVNPTFMDYKMLSATELPPNENIKAMIAAVPHREGPFGAKGLGEGTLVPLAPAVANAIYNAVGVRIRDLPITREKILEGIKTKRAALVR